jgi:hypothetical protein
VLSRQGAPAGAVAEIVLSGTTTGDFLGGLGVPLSALLDALVAGLLLFALTWKAGIEGVPPGAGRDRPCRRRCRSASSPPSSARPA